LKVSVSFPGFVEVLHYSQGHIQSGLLIGETMLICILFLCLPSNAGVSKLFIHVFFYHEGSTQHNDNFANTNKTQKRYRINWH